MPGLSGALRHKCWFFPGTEGPAQTQLKQPGSSGKYPVEAASRATGLIYIPDTGSEVESLCGGQVTSVLSGEPAMGEIVPIHPPLIPFSKLHHQDEVPMATKHESVSMRMQGLAESTLQTSQSKSGGRLYCRALTLVAPSAVHLQ